MSGAWTGKGNNNNTGGKGGGGKGRGKGSYKGQARAGMGGKGMRIFIETNREIVAAARNAREFAALLARLSSEKRTLNGVNVSTILHRSSKIRYRVDPLTLAYLSECLSADEISLQARNVGNALYGLQRLGDSKEVRGLVAALTPKVQQCSEVLTPEHLAMALCGLGQHFCAHELYKILLGCVSELSGLKIEEAAPLIQAFHLSGCADQIPPGLAEQFLALRSDVAAQAPVSKTEEIVQKVRLAYDH